MFLALKNGFYNFINEEPPADCGAQMREVSADYDLERVHHGDCHPCLGVRGELFKVFRDRTELDRSRFQYVTDYTQFEFYEDWSQFESDPRFRPR